MAAVAGLSDRFARVGLTVLRGTGLRLGELLDLELGCVVDYGSAGQWLRVPLGKLNTERSIPLDAATVAAIIEWREHRGAQRALPHTRDGRPTAFLFAERGRRPGKARINRGLADAVRAAGLTGPDGAPLHVTAHQLRHSYVISPALNRERDVSYLRDRARASRVSGTCLHRRLRSPRDRFDQRRIPGRTGCVAARWRRVVGGARR